MTPSRCAVARRGARRARLALLLAIPAAAGFAGCGSGEIERGAATPTPSPSQSATPTPTANPSPTPTPAGVPVGIRVVSTSGALEHAGQAAMFRIKPAGGGVVFCDSVRIDDGDPFGFTLSSSGGLHTGETYDVVELVLGVDGDMLFDAGVDAAYSHAAFVVTTPTDMTLTFTAGDPAAGGWTSGVTWADGTGCPGESQ